MAPEYRRCNTCKNDKALEASEFKARRDEEFSKTCIECLEKKKKAHTSKKDKENPRAEENSDGEDAETDDIANFSNMSAVDLDSFLDALSASQAEVNTITARVDVSSLQASAMRLTADRVAKAVWERLRYRFQSDFHL